MFELDAGGGEHHVACEVDGLSFPRVQVCDLVFVDVQGAGVSGVCFCFQQGPGLVEGEGARTGSVKRTRRTRVAGKRG